MKCYTDKSKNLIFKIILKGKTQNKKFSYK